MIFGQHSLLHMLQTYLFKHTKHTFFVTKIPLVNHHFSFGQLVVHHCDYVTRMKLICRFIEDSKNTNFMQYAIIHHKLQQNWYIYTLDICVYIQNHQAMMKTPMSFYRKIVYYANIFSNDKCMVFKLKLQSG